MTSTNSLKEQLKVGETEMMKLRNTNEFPQAGIVQVEAELIAYYHSTDDQLLFLIRGYAGTTAVQHPDKKTVTFVRDFSEENNQFVPLALTDPVEITAAEVDNYGFFLITTTAPCVLTLPVPTKSNSRTVNFLHNDTSTSTLSVDGVVIDVAAKTSFAWDGDKWLIEMDQAGSSPIVPGDLSTSTSGVTVADGVGATAGPNTTIDVATADSVNSGLLSSTDWSTFNSKLDAVPADSILPSMITTSYVDFTFPKNVVATDVFTGPAGSVATLAQVDDPTYGNSIWSVGSKKATLASNDGTLELTANSIKSDWAQIELLTGEVKLGAATKLTNVAAPSANLDATNKLYVDTKTVALVAGAGINGSFTTVDSKTVTVTKGVITSIV